MATRKQTRLLTAKEIGEEIGRHRETVLDWATAGLIPCFRGGYRTVLFDLAAVRVQMAENGLKPGKPRKQKA